METSELQKLSRALKAVAVAVVNGSGAGEPVQVAVMGAERATVVANNAGD